MSLKVLGKVAAVAALTVVFVGGFNNEAFSQHNRPRYNSRTNNDRGGTLPADTIINMRMNQTLSSRTSRVGDRFTATVADPVSVNGRDVIPAGTVIEGSVTQVTPAKRMSRAGTIAVEFDSIVMPDGRRVGLVGSLTSDDPEIRRKIDDENSVRGGSNDRNTVFVGGGGAIGAILGGIAGGGKGAIIGGGVGAGIGLAGVLLSKGEEAEVRAGTPFGIRLQQSIALGNDPAFDNGSRDNDPSYNDPRDNDPRDNAPRAGDSRPRSSRGRDRDRDQGYDRPNRRDTDPQRDSEPSREPEPRDNPADQRAEPVESQPVDSHAEPAREPETVTKPETTATEPEPAAEALPLSSAEMIRRAQVALQEQGYYEGKADGVMSPRTSNALKKYQSENNLPQTGDLDPATANKLGIMRATPAADRRESRPAESASKGSVNSGNTSARNTSTGNTKPGDGVSADRVVLANVLSATANRAGDGGLYIMINTQANTGGWRWFGEQVANGDTLEVYARAVRPTGIVTQALTRGKIELNVKDGVDFVRRVVVHGAAGDITIPLGGSTRPSEASNTRAGEANSTRGGDSQPTSVSSIQRQAEQMLSEYQRLVGYRSSGNRMEIDSRYGETEIELLFALDNFANAARLYNNLIGGVKDRQEARAATLALAREARKTDRLITTTSSPLADSVNRSWDRVRLEVVRLIRAYNIDSSELDN
jgi:peptidoglycan hydrolase-like protein with peptidoglycan-binding domain